MSLAPSYTTPQEVEDLQLRVSLSSSAGRINLWPNAKGDGFKLHTKVDGLGVADSVNTMTSLPSGGAVLRHQRLKEGDMFLPIQIRSNSKRARNDLKTKLEQILTPAKGPVKVEVMDPYSKDTRSRTTYYRTGLGAPDWSGPTSALYGVTLDYAEPWWRGAVRSRKVKVADRKKPFITAKVNPSGQGVGPAIPFFPVFVYSSVVQGVYTLDIEGDEESWPTWEISGPGKDMLIENTTTGEALFIEGEIFETIHIVTDPQLQDIYSDTWADGQWWDRVDIKQGALFPLRAGENQIRITMVGATQASYVKYAYEEMWGSAY